MVARRRLEPVAIVLTIFVIWGFTLSAQAPDRDLTRDRPRRLALVIGNDAYLSANVLHNAVNDARSMKSALEEAGFKVRISLNSTQQQMEAVIDEFTGSVRPGDIALFFYSGHGMQVNDQNYLIPVDFQARTAVDAKYKAYPAQRIQENLEAAGAGMQILILDACRNNPYKSWRGGSDGLAAMQAGRGTYIAFATAPGKTADDNPNGRNGLFTAALIAVLREARLSINDVFDQVRERVAAKSHGSQIPWSTSSLIGSFYFKVTVESSMTVHPPPESPPRDLSAERELAFWNSVKDEKDPAPFEEYLRKYPDGEFTAIAKSRIARLRTPPAADGSSGTPGDSKLERKVNPKDGLTYVWIPSGTFMMGCLPGDVCPFTEKPSHQVTITKGFWIAQTVTTQEAYERVARINPSETKGPKLPVESVSWTDAAAYCQAAGMRLPTEAEWEYAARGGNTTRLYGDVDQIAWTGRNSDGKAHDVATKQPNVFGLYDMIGSVAEWVADWYADHYTPEPQRDPQGPPTGKERVVRGSSRYQTTEINVTDRGPLDPNAALMIVGFRCAGN